MSVIGSVLKPEPILSVLKPIGIGPFFTVPASSAPRCNQHVSGSQESKVLSSQSTALSEYGSGESFWSGSSQRQTQPAETQATEIDDIWESERQRERGKPPMQSQDNDMGEAGREMRDPAFGGAMGSGGMEAEWARLREREAIEHDAARQREEEEERLEEEEEEREESERASSEELQASMSLVSSAAGMFGQATNLMKSVLGGGSKKATKVDGVKSLQLAAAATRKEQEEKDKKAARLREMESRRQVAAQRKLEEEKAMAMEVERKQREENERRRKEREREDRSKKLKLIPSMTELSKSQAAPSQPAPPRPKQANNLVGNASVARPPSRMGGDRPPSRIGKPPGLGGSQNHPPQHSLHHSQSQGSFNKSNGPGFKPPGGSSISQSATASTIKLVGASAAFTDTFVSTSAIKSAAHFKASQLKHVASSSSLKPPAATFNAGTSGTLNASTTDKGPLHTLQSQMQAGVQAQLNASKRMGKEAYLVKSESIELPDINSEYSDSDDEDRVRTFDPPGWAQSPELRLMLESQQWINPDEIFGAIRPLRMEELFRDKKSRFRARTSSANWSGADRLTTEEEVAYERRMGYTSND